MTDNTEIFTMTDKVRRDQMFDDLRKNGDATEKQVVKFSGVQSISNSLGNKWESTWSVAYPTGRG